MSSIYKYYSIDKFTIKSLINNEIFFSNPLNFNDPFEIEYLLELERLSPKQFIDFFPSELKNIDTFHVKEKEFRFREKQVFNKEVKNNKHLKNAVFEKIGFSCFSKKNDEFLMWSHYGDKHRGICMEFNREKLDLAINIGVEDISYETKLPKIRATIKNLGNNEENLKKIMLTKLMHWEYESEVRAAVYLNESRGNLYNYKPDILESIIFGCKTTTDDKELIRNILKLHDKYNHVKIKDAYLDSETSEVKIKD